MTISNNTIRLSTNGDGVTTVFPVSFPFYEESDLVVVLIASDDTEAVQTLTTHYTVSGGAGSTGTITMVTAPAAGERLVRYRVSPLTQETDYAEGDAFPADSHEAALDRLTMQNQEQADKLARIPALSESTEVSGALSMEEPVAGRGLKWNTTADGIVNTDSDFDAVEASVAANAAAAAASETAAETAAADAALLYDNFDDRYLGAKASDPSSDNDGDALIDGVLYFDTTLAVMKVYDLSGASWKRTTPTTSEQANIDAVSANSANIDTVAAADSNIAAIVTNMSDVNTVGSNISDVSAVAAVDNEVSTVANNLADVSNFASVYLGASATTPITRTDGSSLQVGDLYFDTVADVMKVYDGGAWNATYADANGALLAVNNFSDVIDVEAAKTNLGISSELGFKNLSAWADDQTVSVPLDTPAEAIGKAQVSIFEEIPVTGNTNNIWDIVTNELGFDLVDSAYAATLTPAATTGEAISFTLGSGSWSASDVGKRIKNVSASEAGEANITAVDGATATATITTNFTNTDAIASGDWELYSGEFVSGGFQLNEAVAGATTQEEVGPSVAFDTNNASYMHTARLTDNSFIIVWQDLDASTTGSAIIATAVGNRIVFGSQLNWDTGTPTQMTVAALTSNLCVVCYRDEADSNKGKVRVLTIAAGTTTITAGSAAQFEAGQVYQMDVARVTDSQAIVCYRDVDNSNRATAALINVAGTTATPVTPVEVGTSGCYDANIAALSSTQVVFGFVDPVDDYLRAAVLDIAGNVITPGAVADVSTDGAEYITLTALSSTVVVATYRDNGSPYYVSSQVLTIASSVITAGSANAITDYNFSWLNSDRKSSTEVVLTGGNNTDSLGQYLVLTVSGNTVTESAPKVFHASAPAFTAVVNLTGEKFGVAFKGSGNDGFGCVLDFAAPITPAVSPPYDWSTDNAVQMGITPLTATTALGVYRQSSSPYNCVAVVLTVSGNKVTIGTEVDLNTNSNSTLYVEALSSTSVICCYRDVTLSSYGYAVGMTISGTTITVGSPVQFENAAVEYLDMTALSATAAIVAYRDDSDTYGKACHLGLSGTTVTAQTPATFESASTLYPSICALSATQAVVVYSDQGNSSYLTGSVLNVSGTTITPVTPVQLLTETPNNGLSIVAVNGTDALVCYKSGETGYGMAVVLQVDGSDVITNGSSSTWLPSLAGDMQVVQISASDYYVLVDATNFDDDGWVRQLTVSGTSVTAGQFFQYGRNSSEYHAGCALSSTLILGIWKESSTLAQASVIDLDATYKAAFPTTFDTSTTSYVDVAALTDELSIVVTEGASNYLYAYAVFSSGGEVMVGAALTVSTDTSSHVTVAALNETQAVIAFTGGSVARCIMVTAAGLTLTKGALAAVNSGATIQYPCIAKLSATQLIMSYQDGTSGYGEAAILNVSGTTITPVTPVSVNAAATPYTAIAALSSTQAIMAYPDGGNGNYGTAVILDISGSTITVGAEAVFESASISHTSIVPLTATSALVAYRDEGNSSYLTASVLNVSGSTITPATPAALNSTGSYWISATPVSATQVSVIVNLGVASSVFVPVTISGDVPAAGDAVYIVDGSSMNYGGIATLSDTKYIAAWTDNGDSNKAKLSVIQKLTEPLYPTGQYVCTTSGTDSVDTTYYSDLNSVTVTETLNGETAYYALSVNSTPASATVTGGTFTIVGSGETTGRNIASSLNSVHGNTDGNWYVNTNATYGSETWAAATTNEAKAALEQAMETASNRMSGTALNAISDANLPAFGTNFSIAMIIKSDTTSATPSVDGVSFEYDGNVINRLANDYIVEMPGVNEVQVTSPGSGGPRNARIYISK